MHITSEGLVSRMYEDPLNKWIRDILIEMQAKTWKMFCRREMINMLKWNFKSIISLVIKEMQIKPQYDFVSTR